MLVSRSWRQIQIWLEESACCDYLQRIFKEFHSLHELSAAPVNSVRNHGFNFIVCEYQVIAIQLGQVSAPRMERMAGGGCSSRGHAQEEEEGRR